MNVDLIVNAFVTIIVMFDPPGLAAIFLGLTTGMTRSQRMQVALRGTVTAAGILIVFAIAGASLLGLLASRSAPSASPAAYCCSGSPSR